MAWDDASGVNDYDKNIDFTCRYCEMENVDITAGGRGNTLYMTCSFCKEDQEMELYDD